MTKLILIALIGFILPDNPQNSVIETLYKDFNSRIATKQIGILTTPDHLKLYDLILKSELKFETKNPYENWSLELDISIPKLKYPEKSNMKLWYSPGLQHEMFKGFVASIKFIGKDIELSIHIHEDKNEEEMFVVDYVDGALLEDYDKITVKIIYTEKNIKLELHHGKTLIYDNLRLLDKKYFGELSGGGQFTITAEYNHTKEQQAINLYDARLYERKENEGYNAYHDEVPMNDLVEGEKYEVSESVASFEQFIKYWDVIFGKPKGITIAKLAKAGKNDFIKLSNKIDKIKKKVKGTIKVDDMFLYEKIEGLEKFIMEVESQLGDFDSLMKTFQKNSGNFFSGYVLGFFILFVTIIFILYLRRFEKERAIYTRV